MAATRRTQLLMEPDEYKRLQREARRRKVSVAQLIRSALRRTYLAEQSDPLPIVEAIVSMALPHIDWKKAKKEIEAGHGLS